MCVFPVLAVYGCVRPPDDDACNVHLLSLKSDKIFLGSRTMRVTCI